MRRLAWLASCWLVGGAGAGVSVVVRNLVGEDVQVSWLQPGAEPRARVPQQEKALKNAQAPLPEKRPWSAATAAPAQMQRLCRKWRSAKMSKNNMLRAKLCEDLTLTLQLQQELVEVALLANEGIGSTNS